MFLELNLRDGRRVLVNTGAIASVAKMPAGDRTKIALDSGGFVEVVETYDEIKKLLNAGYEVFPKPTA
jgi:preprotein translocase subunit YajC